MTDIFNSDPAPTTDPFEELVGEGRRYKTPADLAKGKLEADSTIQARERELSELREQFRVAQLELEARRNTPVTPPVVHTPEPPKPAGEGTAIKDEDLVNRIREVTRTEQIEQQRRSNVNTVSQRLVEVYGDADKAREYVNGKARELGVSVDFLMDAAARSPKAFFTTVGVPEGDVTPKSTVSAPRSEVNTAGLNTTASGQKVGTYAYYEQLRKERPNEYFSPRVQNQLMKDARAAQERGEDFFKR